MKQKALAWWRSLSINEMKAFEMRHFLIVFQFNGQTVRMANMASPSQILEMYQKEVDKSA